MLQVIDAILDNPDDKTEVSFILANKTPKDIVPKDYIDKLASKHKNFKVYYVVDKAPSFGWSGGKGFITEDMITTHMPPPAEDNLVLVRPSIARSSFASSFSIAPLPCKHATPLGLACLCTCRLSYAFAST